MKKRFVAVDYGHVRIGLAISDPFALFASPLANIRGSRDVIWAAQETAKVIAQLRIEKKVDIEAIIVGLPLHLNGAESERSQEVRLFVEKLSSLVQEPVELWDERLTTCQAEKSLVAANCSRKKRKQTIDGVSGALLLQSYLDNLQMKNSSSISQEV